MLNGNSRSTRLDAMRRWPRSELKNPYKLRSLNRLRSSSLNLPSARNESSISVIDCCVYFLTGSHCIASCINVPHCAPVTISSAAAIASGLRPNTESASSVSLITGMLVSTTASSSVASSEALLDVTDFRSTDSCGTDTSVAGTASESRSANRRFNSLTEILAVVLDAMRFG